MPPPGRFNKVGGGGGDRDSDSDFEMQSNNLWVGNLECNLTDSALMAIFADYGALDATSYASRSYGFVFFKRAEDAKAAKDALQGTVVKGIPIKIEFARPAKPCNHLWVGGISSSISKDVLEKEFMKFGKVEDFIFLRDRNTAFVEYSTLEDASQAKKNMNGKRIGGEQIRVDFLRSTRTRKDQWSDSRDSRDAQFHSRSMGHFDTLVGSKRQQHSQPTMGRRGDGQPSKVLWIGYPPSVEIDEQMLHNAMILFGEIERITSFPQRHFSFVEFRSIDEARRAKEGLQGRLFNDPRITIMYSSSELAPGKEYPAFHPGNKGPRPDMFFQDNLFQPTEMNIFGHNRPVLPNNFLGPPPPSGIIGANIPTRPFGPRGGFDPQLLGAEFSDLSGVHGLQDANPNNLVGSNWRRPSPPAPGMLPSPSPGNRRPGGWNTFDGNQLQRDPKRSRIDAFDDASFPTKKINERRLELEHSYGLGPLSDDSVIDPYASLQRKSHLSPVGTMVTAEGRVDYIWRGIIAKGGTSVCLARCVPIGKGIGSDLPETVNCSARTGLDMLTKHYAEAIGFEICYFLPDSEDDFASYTEFLRYLGGKDRAGVAKLDDGTTLFLVPPSNFLTKVLKVSGPERLYGVVLKLPQQLPGNASTQQHALQPIPPSHYVDRHHIAPQAEYGLIPLEEQVRQMDYNRVLHEGSKPLPRPSPPPANESVQLQPAPQGYASNSTASISQAGVGLTPELIATLASLLPANTQNPVLETSQPELRSTHRPPFHHAAHDEGGSSQVWKHDQQQLPYPSPKQQSGNQYSGQVPHPYEYAPFPPLPSMANHSGNVNLGSTQVQDAANLPHQGTVSSRPLANSAMPSQNGQFAGSPQISQHYQHEVPHNIQDYGMVHGTDSTGVYGSSGFQTNNPMFSVNQVHGSNLGQPQAVMPSTDNVEIPSQVQQLQSALSGAAQGTSEVEVDKNQRYQSTLQFAANLLLQIQQQQQQQQQTSSPAGRGSGNHQ